MPLVLSQAQAADRNIAFVFEAPAITAQASADHGFFLKQMFPPLEGMSLAEKLLYWISLYEDATTSDFDTVARFIAHHPDWPGQKQLQLRAESLITQEQNPERLRRWFDQYPPITGQAFSEYIKLLKEDGQNDKALRLIRDRWQGHFISADVERDFLKRYKNVLRKEDHWARLDRLIWDNYYTAAGRVMKYVDQGHQNLAKARILLARRKPGVDTAIARIPKALQTDSGLIYERLRWRRRAGFGDSAMQLFDDPNANKNRPDKWWVERQYFARELVGQKDYQRAYKLAANNGLTPEDGFPYLQSEFFTGWLALRFLDNPNLARKHFQGLLSAARTPISVARGSYWLGRTYEAMGSASSADRYFRRASQYRSTYYGQLAALKRNPRAAIDLRPAKPTAPGMDEAFKAKEMVRIMTSIHNIAPEFDASHLFLHRLVNTVSTPAEYKLAAALASDIDEPRFAVAIAKEAAKNQLGPIAEGYPVLKDVPSKPESALIHAIIRQESTFNPTAVSRVGARGLMQLMPTTARQVAKKLGVRHSTKKLTDDPKHNLKLGSAYLQEMIDVWRGSYVLAVASYNAGPTRVKRWIEQNGDPRQMELNDIIDWIESIPIYETRNYVQRVLEATQLYRARLGGEIGRLDLVTDLTRGRKKQ